MMQIIAPVVLIFGTAMGIWGSQTRGEWSHNLATIGGLIWLASLVWLFWLGGLWYGIKWILVSFALGAIFMKLFPRY